MTTKQNMEVNEEILKQKEIVSKKTNKIQESKQKDSLVKLKYSETNFKNFLRNSLLQKVPSKVYWYFASNVLAIDKKYFKNLKAEILWGDENFYYVTNSSDKIYNSFEHFNPEYSLVVFEKNNSTVGVVNGYFIIVLNDNIKDKIYFENQFNLDVISSYPKEKIIVARARKNTNIINPSFQTS